MRVFNATILAVTFASLIACDQGKKDDSKATKSKKTVTEEEMEHRAAIYNEIPQATILRVEIDPKTGEELAGTEEIRQSNSKVVDIKELESAYASAETAKEIDDTNADDYNAALDSSSESFRWPWLLRTPMFRWGYRQGYRKGVYSGYSGDPKQAYNGAKDGYTGSARQMPPVYGYNGYNPRCVYGGYQWHYGPQYVRDQGNYRYYSYAPQGATYYNDGIYDEVLTQPYNYGSGIYGTGSQVTGAQVTQVCVQSSYACQGGTFQSGAYQSSYSTQYNSWRW